jgi:hypothetical protein
VFGPPIAVPRAPAAVTNAKPRNWVDQTREEAHGKSAGCIECHAGIEDMHASPHVVLGCTDCHGGDASVRKQADSEYEGANSAAYLAAMNKAHVAPQFASDWQAPSSANPKRSYTLLNQESPEFIRFNNPTDYRVVRES